MADMTLEKIVEKTKTMLGDNYRDPNPDGISQDELDAITEVTDEGELETAEVPTDLEEICEMVIREAAQWTNRYTERNVNIDYYTSVMNDCWPVIVRCSCIAYLNRGAEGLGSQSELGQQNVYNDWIAVMHKQLTNRRHVI